MPVPLDEGPSDRRRIGPFWLEEGMRGVVLAGVILAVFAVLFVAATLLRPT